MFFLIAPFMLQAFALQSAWAAPREKSRCAAVFASEAANTQAGQQLAAAENQTNSPEGGQADRTANKQAGNQQAGQAETALALHTAEFYKRPSRLFYEEKANQHRNANLHSDFSSIAKERGLQQLWNTSKPDTPSLLAAFLPPDTHFIGHQLVRPGAPTAVKLGQPGQSLMIRAYYKYGQHTLGTNTAFSIKALENNMQHLNEKPWLVSRSAIAAVLFLHGGGTKSTGAHVAEAMISHFSDYNVDVVALDLPWHAEGHREFLGSFENEINALGVFARKFIPPHVPLFVWGHSWGSVFAEKIMKMSEQPKESFHFHDNLKGVMILSTAVDAAPGKSIQEKIDRFAVRHANAMKQTDKFAESEAHIWPEMVEEGKTNPLGSWFTMWTIVQNDQAVPDHKGKNYIPGLMVVGEADPLVFVGFEDLFHNFYDSLHNVETHYLNQLPYFTNPKGPPQRVGHMLGDYLDPSSKEPVQYALTQKFIAKQLGLSALTKINKPNTAHPVIAIAQLFANDLAFREFVQDFKISIEKKTYNFVQTLQEGIWKNKDIIKKLLHDYRTWPVRLERLLKQLESYNKRTHFSQSLSELNRLMKYNIDTLHKTPRHLLHDLEDLHSLMRYNGAVTSEVSSFAKQIKTNFTGYFRNQQNAREHSSFINHVLEAPDYNSAEAIMVQEHLPKDIHRKALALLKQYFMAKHITNSTYEPTQKQIRKRGWPYHPRKQKPARTLIGAAQAGRPSAASSNGSSSGKHSHKIQLILEQLSQNIQRRAVLRERLARLSQSERDLTKQYNQYFVDVQKQIKLIKTALKAASSNPPETLAHYYEQSKVKLKMLVESADVMTQLLEEIVIPTLDQQPDINRMNDMINEQKTTIDDFSAEYDLYTKHRENLQQKLISAVRRGEWGDKKHQKAVLDIYGPSPTDDSHFAPNMETLYFKLAETAEQLSVVEAQTHHVKEKHTALLNEYQQRLKSLLPLVGPPTEGGSMDWINEAANMYHFRSISAQKILNAQSIRGLELHSSPPPRLIGNPAGGPENGRTTDYNMDHQKVLEYIQEHYDDLKLIITKWHQMHSKLPPQLPVPISPPPRKKL